MTRHNLGCDCRTCETREADYMLAAILYVVAIGFVVLAVVR